MRAGLASVLTAALLVTLFSGCGANGQADGSPEVRDGTALADRGFQAAGVIGQGHVRVGDRLMFALPAFDNTTSDPITIESVKVLHIPDGFKLLGYRTLAYSVEGGMELVWDNRYSQLPKVDKFSRPWTPGLMIPARSHGDRYALVEVRVTKPPTGHINGAEVTYTMDGIAYRQEMSGEWGVEMEGA